MQVPMHVINANTHVTSALQLLYNFMQPIRQCGQNQRFLPCNKQAHPHKHRERTCKCSNGENTVVPFRRGWRLFFPRTHLYLSPLLVSRKVFKLKGTQGLKLPRKWAEISARSTVVELPTLSIAASNRLTSRLDLIVGLLPLFHVAKSSAVSSLCGEPMEVPPFYFRRTLGKIMKKMEMEVSWESGRRPELPLCFVAGWSLCGRERRICIISCACYGTANDISLRSLLSMPRISMLQDCHCQSLLSAVSTFFLHLNPTLLKSFDQLLLQETRGQKL